MRNLRDFVGLLNKQLLNEMDTFTDQMYDRMESFFKKLIRVGFEQVEKQSNHLKIISGRLEDSCTEEEQLEM